MMKWKAPRLSPSVRVWTDISMSQKRPWSPFYGRWQDANQKAFMASYVARPYFRRRPASRADAMTRRLNIALKLGSWWVSKKFQRAPAQGGTDG